ERLALARHGSALAGDEPLALRLDVRARAAELLRLALGRGPRELERALLGGEPLDHHVERHGLAREEALGPLEPRGGAAEPPRDGERARRAGDPHRDAEGRAYRRDVEAHRRVREARVAERERLQAFVVRRARRGGAAGAERVEHRGGQALALAGV